jgi:hypothetical protein
MKKNQGFAKNFLLCRLVRRCLGSLTNFILIQIEIYTLLEGQDIKKKYIL